MVFFAGLISVTPKPWFCLGKVSVYYQQKFRRSGTMKVQLLESSKHQPHLSVSADIAVVKALYEPQHLVSGSVTFIVRCWGKMSFLLMDPSLRCMDVREAWNLVVRTLSEYTSFCQRHTPSGFHLCGERFILQQDTDSKHVSFRRTTWRPTSAVCHWLSSIITQLEEAFTRLEH